MILWCWRAMSVTMMAAIVHAHGAGVAVLLSIECHQLLPLQQRNPAPLFMYGTVYGTVVSPGRASTPAALAVLPTAAAVRYR